MKRIGDLLKNNETVLQRDDVNVDNNISINVYDDNVARRIREAIDKPKAIVELLAQELGAPSNRKFYIKLAYQYSIESLFECLSLTKEAHREGRIKTTRAQYFWGIVKKKTYG